MTDQELESALRIFTRWRPFRTFLVEFVSGHQVRVDHPEGIARFKDVWLYRGPKRAQSVFPSSSVCRLLDLTEG
jgi:hypothetical protein